MPRKTKIRRSTKILRHASKYLGGVLLVVLLVPALTVSAPKPAHAGSVVNVVKSVVNTTVIAVGNAYACVVNLTNGGCGGGGGGGGGGGSPPPPPVACDLPWGGTVPSGTSVTAYNASFVTTPKTCSSVSQTSVCNNGSLSITYANKNCTLNHPPVITFSSKDQTITIGQNVTYSASATDQDGNMDALALRWDDPAGQMNYPTGFNYQATTYKNPFLSYSPARSYGLYSVIFTPTSIGKYRIFFSAADPGGWVYSPAYILKVVPKPTAKITATPSTIYSGQSTQISWSSTNATSCISNDFLTGGKTSGNVSSGSITTSTSYKVFCSGAGGTTTGASSTQVVKVLVPTGTLSSYPNRVEANTKTPITFTWSIKNVKKGADTCTISRRATDAKTSTGRSSVMDISSALPPSFGKMVSGKNILHDTVGTQMNYSLLCSNIGVTRVASNQVIINVVPTFSNF